MPFCLLIKMVEHMHERSYNLNKYAGTELKGAALLADYEGVIGPRLSRLPPRDKIYCKMNNFISKLSGTPPARTEEKRLELLRKHDTDTTAYAILMEYKVSYKDFIREVYLPEIKDVGKYITEDKRLLGLLNSIDMPKAVLSNSTREYILRALSAQGIEGAFKYIICIEELDIHVKPQSGAWITSMSITGFQAKGTLYVDDLPRNLEMPYQLGYTTVLISGKEHVSKEDSKYANYVFKDFTSLLYSLARK